MTEYDALLPSEWLQLYVVPPVALIVVLPPSQMVGIDAEAPIGGASFTVTVTVATSVHPLVVPVTVYVVVDDGDAEKEGPLPEGLHEYDEAPLAETVVLLPLQMVGTEADADTSGTAFTVTVTVATSVHPLLVPVTVYVVVDDGDAENEDPLPEGLHEYDDAPLAETVVLLPLQMVGDAAEADTSGTAFTVTVTVAVFEQPLLVPVTV